MARLMRKNDEKKGIVKAAANSKCLHIVKPEIEIRTNDQECLNGNVAEKNINCMRKFGDKGILVWGARTLDPSRPRSGVRARPADVSPPALVRRSGEMK